MKTDLAELWTKTLRVLEREVRRPNFDTWIRSARPIAFHEDTMVLAVPNQFARDWVREHFAHFIRRTLSDFAQRDIQLQFVTPNDQEPRQALTSQVDPDPGNNGDDFAYVRRESPSLTLNPKYTFESFVIGSSNRLAHAASLAVAEAPGRAYNPLFIYGGVGLGKTHLMQGIAHHLLRKNPRLEVVYVPCETFTNEIITAIRDRKTVQFRNRYRGVDLLLVDDIQFLAGKETTQEEFFHTFNALYEANKQIVLSSDRPPKDIPTLEDRLRSRFQWGLISDIQMPDMETRVAILQKKAQLEGITVPDEVNHFVAEQVDTNIRELEGALNRIVADASLSNRSITLSQAMDTLKHILPIQKPEEVSIARIQELVAEFYDLRVRDLKIRKRTRSLAFPRQIAMYLARELTSASLPKIGEEFGGRDHTTVMHACDKISTQRQQDDHLNSTLKELIRLVLQP